MQRPAPRLPLTPVLMLAALALILAGAGCGRRHVPSAGADGGGGGSAGDGAAELDGGGSGSRSCTGNLDCKSNVDPKKSGYCHFASGCGKSGPGICKPLPESCPEDCAGVCGCDGKTHCNTCKAAAAGVSIQYIGTCKTPPPGCATNADCTTGKEYCHIDGACMVTGAKMGACKARPSSCPFSYAPVCGCDDQTYSNSCEAHAKGVNVKSNGACGQTCKAINSAYIFEVSKAKACCAECAALQCNNQIKDELGCPCPTFVNSAPSAKMVQLEQDWNAKGCSKGWACDASLCDVPKYATCKSGGPGKPGTCTDETP